MDDVRQIYVDGTTHEWRDEWTPALQTVLNYRGAKSSYDTQESSRNMK